MSSQSFQVSGQLIDILNKRITPAAVEVSGGKIAAVTEISQSTGPLLLPGFVDAHVHIESSMLLPGEFARAAVVHGTVATVSDPHEIGNVLGIAGVRFMLENAEQVPFKFYFGAPSCVPATSFETAGDRISVAQVEELLDDERIRYLSEMMNVPGVLNGDAEVLAKIRAARDRGKPVDGHAPGLRGEEAKAYLAAGISTDHECYSKPEALDKLAFGAKISIREGSAARNFDALYTLIDEFPDACMLCSDDKHPDELLDGHINTLVKRAVDRGIDPMHALRAACINPVQHYGLDVGLLRPGDDADFIEVDDLEHFRVLRTFIKGQLVAEKGQIRIPQTSSTSVNRFNCRERSVDEFQIAAASSKMNVIEAIDGQLITHRKQVKPTVAGGVALSDPDRDLLKMTVVNRYEPAPPAMAFVKNFGLKQGAIASSVAHDSHNIIAVGVDDADLTAAVNLIVDAGGGLAVAAQGRHELLPLPVAGLMSTAPADEVGAAYAKLDRLAKELGTRLRAPFMTLSFMALLVIPKIKLSDRGLFDGNTFEFLPLFE